MLVFSGDVIASRGTSVAAASSRRRPVPGARHLRDAIFMGSPSLVAADCLHADHDAQIARASTEDFLTFVSACGRRCSGPAAGTQRRGYYSRRGAHEQTPRQHDPERDFPCPPRSRARCARRSLRPPIARSPGQAPSRPLPSNAHGRHGRSARRSASDAPQRSPALYPRPRWRPRPEGVSRTPTRIVPRAGCVLDRVVEHVDQAQPQDGGIARGRDFRRGVDGHALLLLLREHSEMLHDTHGQLTRGRPLREPAGSGRIRPASA